MNNIVEKVKQYFSSNFGKLAGLIIAASFVITLILSVLYKNRIDVSLLKAVISAIITAGILFLLGIVLKKYLGDMINETSNPTGSSDVDYNAIDDNTMSGYESEVSPSSNNAGDTNDVPINTVDNISSESINIDDINKNKKVDYTSGDDIGSIVFGTSNTNTSPTYTSSSSSMFPDKKVKDSEMIKEVQEDPEKVAKAVRTMIAKDEKENK